MPVDLSVKRVPDELAANLRERAARNHRSLQGELMAILEENVRPSHQMTLGEIHQRARPIPGTRRGEAATIVRKLRDSRGSVRPK